MQETIYRYAMQLCHNMYFLITNKGSESRMSRVVTLLSSHYYQAFVRFLFKQEKDITNFNL